VAAPAIRSVRVHRPASKLNACALETVDTGAVTPVAEPRDPAPRAALTGICVPQFAHAIALSATSLPH
jgi:hypothetical protein